MPRLSYVVCAIGAALAAGAAQSASLHEQIDAYLRPYIASGNFSGSILVAVSGKTIFQNGYGLADVRSKAANRVDTKYHIASLSFQFTAAAAMRLAEQGKLSFDTKVSDDFMATHQTPETVVQFIRNRPPVHEPGAPSQDEERAAYNLLALIIEKKTGLPFKEAMRREVFAPLKMTESGIDDDGPIAAPVALGHLDSGAVGLKPAPRIHFSAKPGNGSAYSTVGDEHRWLAGFFSNSFLSDADRQEILDWGDGYGWTRTVNHGLKDPAYVMRGEGPGFASFIIYLPKLKAEIIVLSNAQMPIPTVIGFDLAALLEGREYHAPELRAAPLAPGEVSQVVGRFKFGPDFYRPNATLELAAVPGGLMLRWPGGPDSPVLVTDAHHFIDRHYWTRFSVDDDATGHAAVLTFGRFKGQRSGVESPVPGSP